jgi:hypothetical protein
MQAISPIGFFGFSDPEIRISGPENHFSTPKIEFPTPKFDFRLSLVTQRHLSQIAAIDPFLDQKTDPIGIRAREGYRTENVW